MLKKDAESKSSEINDKMLENMIKLQKVHIDLAEKFDKLSKEISSLLGLFEIAAKNFSKNIPAKVSESDKAFLEKIDKLLEQNKTIAKGLTIMEEQIKNRASPEPEVTQQTNAPPAGYIQSSGSNRPLPRF